MWRILSVFLCVSPLHVAAEEADMVSLTSDPFNEIVSDGTKISGTSLLGLVASSANTAPPSTPAISAWLPADWAGSTACLRVVSSDGFYESKNTYSIAVDWTGGRTEFFYPTQEAEVFAARSQASFAVSVTKGSCDDDGEETVLAFWTGDSVKEISLYVNSFRADETLVYLAGDSSSQEVSCKAAPVDVRTVFDTVCPLPKDWFQSDTFEVVVLPIKNGEMGSESRLRLRGGQLH